MNRRDFIKNAIAAACVLALPVRANEHLSRFRNLARLEYRDGLCNIVLVMDGDAVFMSARDYYFRPTPKETTKVFTLFSPCVTSESCIPAFDDLLARAPLIGTIDDGADVLGMYAHLYPDAKHICDAEQRRFEEILYGNKRRKTE